MTSARRPSTVSRRLLVGIILSGTLSVLDSTLVVPLLTTIGDDLGGGSEVSWLVAAYLIASTVTIPLWGRWLDVGGERTPMWSALALFLVGTVLAMVAPTLEVLIAARVVQGIGAGGLVPLGQAVLAARCSAAERARLQIYYNVAYGLAAGLGPLVGGALIDASWRWAFAIIVPVIVVVGVLLLGQLRATPKAASTTGFDYLGSAYVTVGLVAVLLGVERGWWWCLFLGLVVLVVFGVRSRRLPHGLIPEGVLRNRVVIACATVALLVGFSQFAFLTYLPALSQQVAPDVNPGLVVIPLTVLWMTLGAGTGLLALRVGTRLLAIAAAACAALAGAVVALALTMPALLTASTLVGAAAGLALIPTLLLAQHAAPSDEVGAATSLLVLLRNFGGALGVAVVAVLLADVGRPTTFWMLAAVGIAMVVPALLLPGRAGEERIRQASDRARG